ncbi:MAG: LysE family transporter [Bacteroidetes bacterium]|nr:LysE family transporter [Bacteroidota bacterium]
MQFFIQAFSIGFLLSVLIGPVFFILLETSITKGFRAAISFDLGVFLSDLLYILIAVMFMEQIKGLDTASNKILFSFIGGTIFILYGLFTFFKKPALTENSVIDTNEVVNMPVTQTKDYVMLGVKGFLLNFANPLVIFYWLSVASFANQFAPDKSGIGWVFLFISIVLLTFFGVDILKILAAKKLRPLVNQKLLTALNRVIGIVFCLFGVFLILQNLIQKT